MKAWEQLKMITNLIIYSRVSAYIPVEKLPSLLIPCKVYFNLSIYDILQVLVQNTYGKKLCRGADVNLNTPLHIAAKFGHLASAKVRSTVLISFKYPCSNHNRGDKSNFVAELEIKSNLSPHLWDKTWRGEWSGNEANSWIKLRE